MVLKTEAYEEESESFANRLARAGYTDFYVISREDARKLLTDKRTEIIDTLKEKEFSSTRELARELDRDIKQVSEDLDILQQISVIEYREEGNRKIPKLKHQRIFIEPIE
jgi:predicted transcriptional regulator